MLQIVGTTNEPTPTPADPEIDFDTFWICYPRKVAKKDARRAWDRIPATEHVAIMAALWSWRRYWDDRGDPEYIMYPSTYLNGERWTDELPKEFQYRPPRINGATGPAVSPAAPEKRGPIPEHVLAMIAKVKGGNKA